MIADIIELSLQYYIPGVLVVGYVVALVHNGYGQKCPFVNMISGMLLAAMVCSISGAYSEGQYDAHTGTDRRAPALFYTSMGLFTLFLTLFSVAHWLIAEKYYVASIEMPYVVEQVRVPKRKWCAKQTLNRTMITLNVLASFLDAVPYWFFKNQSIVNGSASEALTLLSLLGYYPQIILFLVSGIFLLVSINKIRAFMKEHDQSVNTKNMWLHALSFGTFTLSFLLQGFSSIMA